MLALAGELMHWGQPVWAFSSDCRSEGRRGAARSQGARKFMRRGRPGRDSRMVARKPISIGRVISLLTSGCVLATSRGRPRHFIACPPRGAFRGDAGPPVGERRQVARRLDGPLQDGEAPWRQRRLLVCHAARLSGFPLEGGKDQKPRPWGGGRCR